jgi:hypothetical protein
MKKASYRLLQWTMAMGTLATMATACVVTSGDDDDSPFDGGESGSSTTAGKTSTEGGEGGTTATGGKTSAGSSSGGTAGSSAGSGTGGSAGGATSGTGGTGSGYVPGLCEGEMPEPTMLPSCAPAANDEGQTCKICLKAQCCTEWKTCYGDTPTSACGWGKTESADGQWDCIQNCYLDGLANATDLDKLQQDCADSCLNQCEGEEADMGFITSITLDLSICANDKCKDACFPAQ